MTSISVFFEGRYFDDEINQKCSEDGNGTEETNFGKMSTKIL